MEFITFDHNSLGTVEVVCQYVMTIHTNGYSSLCSIPSATVMLCTETLLFREARATMSFGQVSCDDVLLGEPVNDRKKIFHKIILYDGLETYQWPEQYSYRKGRDVKLITSRYFILLIPTDSLQ